MQAIETEYKGIRFRSRLEARWAVFFDAMEMPWRYESEAYKIGLEDEPIFYLPDFYLPKTETWVEVKGAIETIDWKKTLYALDWNLGLPNTNESRGTSRGLLLLGDVPFIKDQYPCHPLLQHHKGVLGYLSVFNAAGDLVPVGVHGPGKSQELSEKQHAVRQKIDELSYSLQLDAHDMEQVRDLVAAILAAKGAARLRQLVEELADAGRRESASKEIEEIAGKNWRGQFRLESTLDKHRSYLLKEIAKLWSLRWSGDDPNLYVTHLDLAFFAYGDAITGYYDELVSFVTESIDGTRSLDQLYGPANYKVSAKLAKAYAAARGHRFYEGKATRRNTPPVRTSEVFRADANYPRQE